MPLIPAPRIRQSRYVSSESDIISVQTAIVRELVHRLQSRVTVVVRVADVRKVLSARTS